MNLIKPKTLKSGDTISIIAPAGNPNYELIEKAKEYFESLNYKVVLGKNLFKRKDYLSAIDEDRLEDLHEAFSNKEINAIICARGGYGSLRLINKIDYNLIKNNPKIFCGYSDITVLNMMLLKNSNLITFSGPMAQSDFANEINKFTIDNFFETLTTAKIELTPDIEFNYNEKDVDGILIGGNLASFVSLCGIDFLPNKKFIFFAEDLNEPVYKIDKYFTQLFNIETFKNNIQAIILGDFLDIDNKVWFDSYFKNLAQEYNIPIMSKFPISHSDKKTTIPYGAKAKITNSKLIITNYINE